MFQVLHHADWSIESRKRWISSARRLKGGWVATAPVPVGAPALFLDGLFAEPGTVLAGFDFPIGLPAAFGRSTGFPDFRAGLDAFGVAEGWTRFFDVATLPGEVDRRRPFYPRLSTKGVTRATLVAAHGVASFDELFRTCERGGDGKRRGASLFWTLGGNQVGKAAITGWREVVRPALRRGAAVWPFDGDLATLSERRGPVIAETYPADAYAPLGAAFGPRESKRSQISRRAKAEPILAWASSAGIDIDAAVDGLRDGFGSTSAGEDAFDAFVGLLAMIAVVDGLIPERSVTPAPDVAAWEGWILGR